MVSFEFPQSMNDDVLLIIKWLEENYFDKNHQNYCQNENAENSHIT
jgi:hypothetical protein